MKEMTFLVFNTACFGDVLLCNPLCQNIKKIWPNSRIIFICDKNFKDVAKYQKDVDDIVIYDKKGEHSGFKGMLKFIKEFKHKNIYASFITYKNYRNALVAKLLGSKYIINGDKNRKKDLSTQEQHINLLKKITNKDLKNYPCSYISNNKLSEDLKFLLNNNENYVALCALTKRKEKDIPLETSIDLIKKFNSEGKYNILFLGVGKENEEYAKRLDAAGCSFINLVNKTTITELANILTSCKALISPDTGTMHLGCAVGVPTLAVFYENNMLANWAPNPCVYNVITLSSYQTASNIYNSCLSIIEPDKEKKMTVVIPTLQKNTELLINLLKILENDRVVDEILLIDNSLKGLDYTSKKLRVITPEHNIFVNPAWNLGVKEARNSIVALLNDDITIAPNYCTNIANQMNPKMGAIGACYKTIKETTSIEYSIEDNDNLELLPIDLITYHWGIGIFFYKSSYIEIPDEIKIFRGDDWIFYQNRALGRQNYYIEGQIIYHYGSLTSKSKTLKPIGKRDRHYYRKYTKKWYNFFFDKDILFDGTRYTVLGLKIVIKRVKNEI